MSYYGRWPDGGNTMRPDFNATAGYSLFAMGTSSPAIGMMPQAPRKHIMKCRSCGRSSMIPDSTDKIMALVCPQCGGALDE